MFSLYTGVSQDWIQGELQRLLNERHPGKGFTVSRERGYWYCRTPEGHVQFTVVETAEAACVFWGLVSIARTIANA